MRTEKRTKPRNEKRTEMTNELSTEIDLLTDEIGVISDGKEGFVVLGACINVLANVMAGSTDHREVVLKVIKAILLISDKISIERLNQGNEVH